MTKSRGFLLRPFEGTLPGSIQPTPRDERSCTSACVRRDESTLTNSVSYDDPVSIITNRPCSQMPTRSRRAHLSTSSIWDSKFAGIIFMAASPNRQLEPTRRGFDDKGSMSAVRRGTTPHMTLKFSTVSNQKQLTDGTAIWETARCKSPSTNSPNNQGIEPPAGRTNCGATRSRTTISQSRGIVGKWRKHGECDSRRPPNYASSDRWRCGGTTKGRVRRDLS